MNRTPNITKRVLLTDHPWPGTEIEAGVLKLAGYDLVEAPAGSGLVDLLELGGDVEGILTCWSPVPKNLIEASPRLMVVSRLGVGVDNIDVAAAARRGIVVTRVPDYCVEEVSDHVLAMVLGWARGIPFFDRAIRDGRWQPGAIALRRVRDLVVGVWGTGNNGIRTAEKMAALGCRVLLDDRHPERRGAMEAVTIDELLEQSDVVSLHLPLNRANRGIVDAGSLARMRPGSLLVNTSRGALIDIDSLLLALAKGRPAAAALDVLPDEPSVPKALIGRDDVLLTPHVAFSSSQSVREVRQRATEDLVRVLQGKRPEHPYPR